MTEKETTDVRGKATQTFAHGAHVFHKGSVRTFTASDFEELEKARFLKKTAEPLTNYDGSKIEEAAKEASEDGDPPSGKDKGNAPQNKGK